jgi:clan AA aspartic protease (TIGR02281 family)
MRQALAAFGMIALACCVATADAAALEPSRITAIDQAADAFLAKAAEARKTGMGMVPRQSDPGVRGLLDTVFDTGDLSHGAVPYSDLGKLNDWLSRIVAIGRIYLAAGKTARDFGLFGIELGRFFDAAVAVQQAIADCLMAELDAHPGEQLKPADLNKLARLRAAIGDSLNEMIGLFHAPGITVGWAMERLTALRAAAPSMARFLTPAQLARLRASTLRLAATLRERALRQTLGNLAEALATPLPPIAAAEPPPGSAEIALESDGRAYSVPGRVNGVVTVKFLVDSGASVVVLPKDMVETLIKDGVIAASDLLGRDVYVTADGRRHHGTRLMLRQIEVGGHTVTNVMASIAPAHAEPLLGLSFLSKFKSWTLDNKRHVLIISE